MGKPKGSSNAVQNAARSRTAPTQINKNATPGRIRPEDETGPTSFLCSCCGKTYTRQQGNFMTTLSPLFAGNNGYLTMCKRCVDRYYDQLVDYFTGNEEKALERICQIADWYYLDDIFASAKKAPAAKSVVTIYPSKMQLWKKNGTTYLDTINDRASAVVSDYDEFEDMVEAGETGISKAMVKRWGLGFEESEYRMLDEHYRSLAEVIDTTDIVQDTLAKDLCVIKIQQIRARNANDVDRLQKLIKLYQDTLKSAKINVRRGEGTGINDSEACWGNFIRDVERYCPADYYKDKSLYKDFDGLKDYFVRFILRPVKNFFLGTREMDEEFSIGVGDGEEDKMG